MSNNNKLTFLGAILGFCLLVLPSYSVATVFNFDITYDGVSQSLDAGSDPMTGTSLVVGDGFVLDFHAAGGSYWEVLNTSWGIYGSLFVQDGGARIGNVSTSFLLDGGVVAQDIDLGLRQANVHIGAQSTTLPLGLLFDQVIVDYTLLSTVTSFTTIKRDGLNWTFTSGDLAEYNKVPEPSILALMGLGLAGLWFARRKKA